MTKRQLKSDMDRREFLKGTAWMAAVAAAGSPFAGCMSLCSRTQGMGNFACAPMKRIRLAFIGVGERGGAAVHRVVRIPGCEVSVLCDLRTEAVAEHQKWLKDNGLPQARRTYSGHEESFKAACDDSEVDVVYIAVPAALHTRMSLYAMAAGKHVLVEVPAASTIDDCWALVEASEKTRRHCMMLENCCYGENEMLAWNLCHQGVLGTLSHAEGGYIHNLVWRHLEDSFRNRANKTPGTVVHRYGNTYPTHALGPICQYMDINRGDRMERIVSVSSGSFAHPEYAAARYKASDWQNKIRWLTGDMNTSIIKTAKGRTIMMQVDQSTPRPYSRINLIQGTKGCFYDYPLRISLEDFPGGDYRSHADHAHWVDDKRLAEIREKYRHPLWKVAGKVAEKVGGHGGMDFLMDVRWAYCLQNGLPLDMDVYDLAAWSSIVPCSAESDRRGGEPVEIPDFTRGAWKTAAVREIGDVDLRKMGFHDIKIKDDAQLSV